MTDYGYFTCEMCKGQFPRTTPIEQAEDECQWYFGVKDANKKLGKGMVEVCDDCFNRVHPDEHPVEMDLTLKHLKKEGL